MARLPRSRRWLLVVTCVVPVGNAFAPAQAVDPRPIDGLAATADGGNWGRS
jgi:hypothetical protein